MSHVTTCTYQAFPAFLYCKHENLGGDLGRRLAEVRVRSGWGLASGSLVLASNLVQNLWANGDKFQIEVPIWLRDVHAAYPAYVSHDC